MESKEVDVLFVLPDISGYTKYMLANERSLQHAQSIVTELIRTLIKQVNSPLQLAEIEGDALFLYAIKKDTHKWQEDRKAIGLTLQWLSKAFYERVKELTDTKTCDCGACSNVASLRIKVVAHSGRAVIAKIDRFLKISGVDTIIAHRLLKNSIPSHDYIFVTKQAFNDIEFSNPHCFKPHSEEYDDVGVIEGMLCLTGEDALDVRQKIDWTTKKYSLFNPSTLILYCRIGLDLALIKLKLKRRGAVGLE